MLLAHSVTLYWLLLGLCLFYINFVIDIGNYKTYFYFSIFFLILAAVFKRASFSGLLRIRELHYVVFCSLLVFILAILPFEYMEPQKSYVQHIVYFCGLTVALVYLFRALPEKVIAFLPVSVVLLFAVGTSYQLVGIFLESDSKAYFWNPHFLAQFCLFALAIFLYTLTKLQNKLLSLMVYALILGTFYLLVCSQSRPAWISMVAAFIAVNFLYFRGAWRYWGVLGLAIFLVGSYLLFPTLVGERFANLVKNISTEERVYVWQDSLTMQGDVSLEGWVTGYGPGSFVSRFHQGYSSLGASIEFPHNFFFELLYESGLVGLVAVMSLYGMFCLYVHKAIRTYDHLRATLMVIFGVFIAQWLFAFLTLPFYSKYVLLTQAPLIAVAIFMISSERINSSAGEQIERST